MADGDSLPPEDHIIRHLSYTKYTETEDGLRPNFSAFEPKEREEEPSVNWVEYNGERAPEVSVPKTISLITRDVKASHRFPKINIGRLKETVYAESSDSRRVDVLHRPESNNQSHAGISNIRPYDDEISDIISDCIDEWYDPEGNAV